MHTFPSLHSQSCALVNVSSLAISYSSFFTSKLGICVRGYSEHFHKASLSHNGVADTQLGATISQAESVIISCILSSKLAAIMTVFKKKNRGMDIQGEGFIHPIWTVGGIIWPKSSTHRLGTYSTYINLVLSEHLIMCTFNYELIHFPNAHNSQGWGRRKSGATNSVWVCHVKDRDSYLNHQLLLPAVCISRKPERKVKQRLITKHGIWNTKFLK